MKFFGRISHLGIGTLLVHLFVGCATFRSGGSPREEALKWVALAEAALSEADSVGALQALQRAESIDADLTVIHHARALAFLLRSDAQSAMNSAEKAFRMDQKDSAIATTYGKILMDAHRDTEAERVLLPAARDPLYREAFKARTNLGVLKFRQNDLAAARLHLDRAILEAPDRSCLALHLRGRISVIQGRLREAIGDFEQATRRFCAGYGEAHVSLGSALAADRQYDKARRKFLEIGERFRGTPWASQAMERLREIP